MQAECVGDRMEQKEESPMLRLSRNQPSLWESILPPELFQMSEVLCDCRSEGLIVEIRVIRAWCFFVRDVSAVEYLGFYALKMGWRLYYWLSSYRRW